MAHGPGHEPSGDLRTPRPDYEGQHVYPSVRATRGHSFSTSLGNVKRQASRAPARDPARHAHRPRGRSPARRTAQRGALSTGSHLRVGDRALQGRGSGGARADDAEVEAA